jgi:hypothetical protein
MTYIPSAFIEKKYTNGNEYVYSTNGKKYIGYYNIINGNKFYSGDIFNNNSIELFPISNLSDLPETIDYDIVSDFKFFNLKSFSPINFSYNPPNEQDYQKGSYRRYFVKNRLTKIGGITEVNYETFKDLFDQGGKYDYNIYEPFYINWNLTQIQRNIDQLNLLSRRYLGLKSYLKNPSQFVRQ